MDYKNGFKSYSQIQNRLKHSHGITDGFKMSRQPIVRFEEEGDHPKPVVPQLPRRIQAPPHGMYSHMPSHQMR